MGTCRDMRPYTLSVICITNTMQPARHHMHYEKKEHTRVV